MFGDLARMGKYLGQAARLMVGVPGLAKTLTVRTLCDTVSAKFQRIQFTSDLLPADIADELARLEALVNWIALASWPPMPRLMTTRLILQGRRPATSW